jgi:uncharacterized protein (DUF924 family)
MSPPETILEFWFGDRSTNEYGKPRQVWFQKKPEFDETVRSRFLDDYQAAASGQYDDWTNDPRTTLALILLLDQFPRNLFRDRPEAFATDTKALEIAKDAIARGFDRQLLPVERWFVYLPFEHSENLENQRRSVEFFHQLEGDPDSATTIDYADRHFQVIERFGRFPHRNQILGRPNTPEEAEFLQQPGSSF